MEHIAKNLKYLRTLNKLTQKEFGEMLGLNRGNIASYENKGADPSIETLLLISERFQVDLNDLVRKDLEVDLPSLMSRHPATPPARHPSFSDSEAPKDWLVKQSEQFAAALIGMRYLYDLKTEKQRLKMRDRQLLQLDYERLLDMMSELLRIHQALIKRCGEEVES